MAGDHRVRRCSRCSLDVFDLSELTRDEAHALLEIKLGSGRMCGRFYQRADGTILSRDCPRGLAAMRMRARLATATVAYSLGFASLATALVVTRQREPAPVPQSVETVEPLAHRIPKNFRATDVRVSRGPIAEIQRGDSIDLIAFTEDPEPRSVTLLQNVLVFGVDATTSTMTMMMTPDEAQKVAAAQSVAAIHVTLRSKWEGNTQVPLEPTTIDASLGVVRLPQKRAAMAMGRLIRAGEY